MIGDRCQPRASIVIRAYHEARHFDRLLTGIRQQTLDGKPVQNIEVILVDSGSSDATLEIASQFKAPFPIRIVHIQPEELTFVVRSIWVSNTPNARGSGINLSKDRFGQSSPFSTLIWKRIRDPYA